MDLKKLKVLSIIADEYEDLEFWVPAMRLQEEGIEIVVAGKTAGTSFRGKSGVSARSQYSFASVDPSKYHALLIPGGWAPDKLRRDPVVLEITRTMYQANKIIGMICHAGLVGISAGIVSGHKATGSEGIKDDLINAGAEWVDEPAFRSGNLVWGRVVADIPYYCRELVAALKTL